MFTGYDIEVEFCGVDPALIAIDDRAADRCWTPTTLSGRVPDELRRSTPVTPGSPWRCGRTSRLRSASRVRTARYGYFLVPFVKGGIIGDFTIANDAVNFTLSGAKSARTATPGVSARTTWSRGDAACARRCWLADRRRTTTCTCS